MAKPKKNHIFDAGPSRPVLILASRERIRHMTIRPVMTIAAAGLFTLLTVGSIGSAAYLAWRDDLLGAASERQARLQQDYEDRITTLRAEIERITSRQMIEQRTVQARMDQLLRQQTALVLRHDKLEGLVQRAEASGLSVPETADEGAQPLSASAFAPAGAADRTGRAASEGIRAIDRLLKPDLRLGDHAPSATGSSAQPSKDAASATLSRVSLSLDALDQQQQARVFSLTRQADRTADAIATIMRRTGVSVGLAADGRSQRDKGVGGPFVPPLKDGMMDDSFDAAANALDVALTRLEAVRRAATTLPYGNPAPGREITSGFGNRIDPFLGRLALHAGVDFQAETGQRVRSTGAGRIVAAGESGGYGNMVDIDHGQGLVTRYGHLSRILVREGDTVAAGDVIGLAGSTGRSTAPHVHYEVHQDGQPIDPATFLNAGLKLKAYLQ
ncbi:M23 family metallopeptidase [Rhizobium straminoryzae]|uniref:M23 family metallopeptidase n=1 Tax=Rhizobium straminoryzae TaxID=1387186 RepID=UPI001FE74E29|nr:M23 family metallopeptidase [Rhizobium straminoryzae]